MRRSILTVLGLACLATLAAAQEIETPPVLGYGFFGSGVAFANEETSPMLFHTGGGAELRLYKGLSSSTEVGYLFPRLAPADGFGIFSTNALYHVPVNGRVVPFATGGYSLAFRGGTDHGANFGGGVDVWATDKAGLRFEARDHVSPGASGFGTAHFLMFRVGLLFR